MKNLFKISIFFVLFSFALQGYAQTFEIKGGLSMAKMMAKDDDRDYDDNFKMQPGFHVGFNSYVPISGDFFFSIGLLFTTKGTKMDVSDVTAKTNLYYLDLPLNAMFQHEFGGITLIAQAGPYVGLGLFGKNKIDGKISGENISDEEDIEWGSDDEDDLKRLDFGLTFGGGVALNNLTLGLSYDLGLANVWPTDDNGAKESHRILKLSLGYRFGK